MIVQALKSSVVSGPKLRSGDSAGLLVLSDKLENCSWALTELESNELDCTTNLRQIYDRLPDPLQRKWRKSAKLYRERACGREPTLKELTKFITEEAQVENNPVYGRVNDGSRSHNNYNFKKTSPNLRAAGSKIITLATEVWAGKSVVGPELGDFPAVGKHPDGTCMVCKEGVHRVSRCAAFSSKNLNWRRTFARQNKL